MLGGNTLEFGPFAVMGGCLGALEKPTLGVYELLLVLHRESDSDGLHSSTCGFQRNENQPKHSLRDL